mgnify:CR=1 FL=1
MTKLWIATTTLALALGPLACTKTDNDGSEPAPKPTAEETPPAAPTDEAADTNARRVDIEVTAKGYTPATVEAEAGKALTLVFERTSEKGCGEKLVFPDLDIERELPLDEAVVVELTPEADQKIAFTCGMGMYEGSVVAVR